MTYSTFDASGTLAPRSYVRDDSNGERIISLLAYDSGIGYSGWIANGLEYSGAPGGIGTWTVYPSDLHPGQWALRTPANVVLGYTPMQSFAEEIAAAMSDYPEPDPTQE
jgi:hypothetical protein